MIERLFDLTTTCRNETEEVQGYRKIQDLSPKALALLVIFTIVLYRDPNAGLSTHQRTNYTKLQETLITILHLLFSPVLLKL